MSISTSDMSPADIAACTGNNGYGNGWGGDWFAWIIIFALIFGWGGNGFRGIDQRLTAQELAAKDAQIAEQNQRLFMAELRASQEAQTNGLRGYIDGQFAYYNPQARPAYIVPNPNCCYQGCGTCA